MRRVRTSATSGQWRFVAETIASCFGVLATILALNLVVDPYALAGTHVAPSAVETDRAAKLTLIERLKKAPEILVLGSSRSRQAEPSVLQQLTGHRGFNAGVTGGSAADAYVFTRLTADRFPKAKRHYVWFVDAGIATNGINPQLAADSRAKKYLLGSGGGFGLKDIGTYLSTQASRASLRVLDKCVVHTCQAHIRYRADGSIPHGDLRYLPEQAKNLQADVAKLVASIRARPPVRRPVDPRRYAFFEKTLAFMNARGERPVIVLNPIYPSVLAELDKHGFPERVASLAYLAKLHHRFDFVLVNCEDIHAWNGSPKDFSNPTHVNWRNMRRMLGYIVGHSDDTLR